MGVLVRLVQRSPAGESERTTMLLKGVVFAEEIVAMRYLALG